jgi:hypothetical protein
LKKVVHINHLNNASSNSFLNILSGFAGDDTKKQQNGAMELNESIHAIKA